MKEISILVFGSCCTRDALLSQVCLLKQPQPIALYANHIEQFVGGYLLDLRDYGASCHLYIDGCRKECVIDEKPYLLEFEDGYPWIEYPELIKYSARANSWQGFLLLYDVDSRKSLDIIEHKLEKLAELTGSKGLPPPGRLPRVYLVADSTWPVPGRQQIDAAEGRALAERFGCTFIEHSSQSHNQVQTLVMAMARECIERGMDLPIVPRQSAIQGQQRCSIRSVAQSLMQRVSRVFK